jgi:Tol biopolymer transport system component
MNCEQVEERLSAYLDNMLAPDERRAVTLHLQTCPRCMALLAELRQNDILLAQLPRVAPSPVLRERLFLLPEVRELSKGADLPEQEGSSWIRALPSLVQAPESREQSLYTWFPSLAGGYSSHIPPSPGEKKMPPAPPLALSHSSAHPTAPLNLTQTSFPSRSQRRWFSPLNISLTLVLLMTLGSVSVLSLVLQRRTSSANPSGAMTPPAGPLTGQPLPLAAGARFVFLRNGTLWSTLTDGNAHQPERLTPSNVTVAPGWVVSAPAAKHTAGDLLAYIDLQSAQVHTIRSDGQQDTPVPLSLLKANPSVNWQSNTGQVILASLSWSPDSSMLAFVADPTGSGQPGLYLALPTAGSVDQIATDLRGSFAHLAWSPDGTRLAFALTRAGVENVLEYNIHDRSVLDLSNLAAAQGNALDSILALNWFSRQGQSAVTWSLGSIGHIRSVWLHRVGAHGTLYPQRLLSGEYLQALYSPGSNDQTGGWLLVESAFGQAGDIWRLNLASGDQFIPLSQGKQVDFARWSPDGSTIFYLDGVLNGQGNGHLVNILTGSDQRLPDQIAIQPAPDWSADGQRLVYSTGTHMGIVHMLNSRQSTYLHLSGQVISFSWSSSMLRQLVVSLGSPDPGLYLVDTQQNNARQLDSVGTDSIIQWTAIP